MMQRMLRGLMVLALAAGFLPAAVAAAPSSQGEVVTPDAVAAAGCNNPIATPSGTVDDELVLLDGEGRIVVCDPYVPAGIQRVVWQSPETGFFAVDTGDFNNDGDDEIIGLRSTQLRIYDPVPKAGSPNVTLALSPASGQTWQIVATGKWFSNRGDGFVVQESRASGAAYFMTYSFNGSSWQQVLPRGDIAVGMRQFASGDVDGNREDEIIGIRQNQLIIWNPSNNGALMYESSDFLGAWLAIASGNVIRDNPDKDDVLATRSGVSAPRASFVVWRWLGNNYLEELASAVFEPPFQQIATGDVNISGDEEVFLLRPGNANGTNIVALTARNYGGDQPVQWDDLTGQTKWKKLHTGDLDGDHKAELVVMSTDQYLIYTDPAAGTAKTSTTGSFVSTANFAIGNLDGAGAVAGPTLHLSTTSVTLSGQTGQTATQPVQITNTGLGTLNWTASVTSGGNWLSVSPPAGTAPSTLTVTANAAGLVANTYTGAIVVAGEGTVANSPQTINVTFNVTTPPFYVWPTDSVSWSFREGNVQATPQTIALYGNNNGNDIPWHLATAVQADDAPAVVAALEAGAPISVTNGMLVLGEGEGAIQVPTVNWLTVSPTAGIATPSGTQVTLTPVPANVPYGVSKVTLIFLADVAVNPQTVIVYATIIVYRSDFSDATFLPLTPE